MASVHIKPYFSIPFTKTTLHCSMININVLKAERTLIKANGLQLRQVYSSLSLHKSTLKHQRLATTKALLIKLK